MVINLDQFPAYVAQFPLLVTFNGDGGQPDRAVEMLKSPPKPNPVITGFFIRLDDLPATLKEVWVSRREVIARMKAGEAEPIFDGRWTWAVGMKGPP